jgi:dephospho-CoA kinase
MASSVFIIGLTGGIACGKSYVASLFAEKGAAVIDCDKIVKELQTENEEVRRLIKQAFPLVFEIADGQEVLNRAELSKVSLSSAESLAKTEKIVLPFVLDKVKEKIADFKKQGKKIILLDAPLLFESGADALCSLTICVYAGDEMRRQRYLSRSGADVEKLAVIDGRQMSLDEKMRRADVCIKSENEADTKETVEKFFSAYI